MVITDKTLKDLEGNVLKDPDGKQGTVFGVIIDALLTPQRGEESLPGEEKLKRWELARKIHGKFDVDLSLDELTLIKTLVGKAFGPVVVGQVWSLLEGK